MIVIQSNYVCIFVEKMIKVKFSSHENTSKYKILFFNFLLTCMQSRVYKKG